MSVLAHEWIKTQSGNTILSLKINAERSLNALNLEMINLMRPLLKEAAQSERCKAVIIDSEGNKAFCAGGDVVSLHNAIKHGDIEFCETYFEQEYRLDYELHTFPKPVITWGGGIVMGGGMGLLTSSSHSIVTETSLLAMPEITIALYPDVGASWFLNRLHGRLGLFLALTGARLNAMDAQFLGLSSFVLNESQKSLMTDHLLAADWGSAHEHAVVNRVLNGLAKGIDKTLFKPEQVQTHLQEINQIMQQNTRLEMFRALSEYSGESAFMRQASKTFKAGSPLSAHVIVSQLERTKYLSLKEVFELELALSVQCCAIGEFGEGVRALLVDKDGAPQWRDSNWASVSAHSLDAMLSNPFKVNPLKGLDLFFK
jgi:enoyl-CoA hydratase/carnithine racemase